MKKILITLLVFTFYCNNSFAVDFPLVVSINKATAPNFSYKKLAFLEKSKITCKVTRQASKSSNFIQEEVCDSNGSDSACLVYTDKKPNPLPKETYCFSSTDLLLASK
jgi:hypothetical protein